MHGLIKPLERLLSEPDDAFFYIGHSSALLKTNQRLVLLDPVWGDYRPYGDYWEFKPEQVNLDQILPFVDCCIISHIHADHWCSKILNKLSCPIFIMNGRAKLKTTLQQFGRIQEWSPYKWHSWPKNPEVYFYFVPHPFNTVDSSVFIRTSKNCFYHGSDNFLDQAVIDKIKPDIDKVDLAMVPYAFIHYYPHLCESLSRSAQEKETRRLKKQSLDQAKLFVDAFKPEVTIPFGASLFYVEGPNDPLNSFLATPFDFKEAIPLVANNRQVIDRRHYKSMISELDLKVIKKRVREAPRIDNFHIIVNDLVIDLENLTISNRFDLPRDYVLFHVEQMEFKKWLRGELSFEQVLGTRRFTYKRKPNVYRLDVVEWFSKYL